MPNKKPTCTAEDVYRSYRVERRLIAVHVDCDPELERSDGTEECDSFWPVAVDLIAIKRNADLVFKGILAIR